MQNQLDEFEKEWRDFLASMGDGGIGSLTQSLKSMKNDLDNLSRAFAKAMADRQESESAMRVSRLNETQKKSKKSNLNDKAPFFSFPTGIYINLVWLHELQGIINMDYAPRILFFRFHPLFFITFLYCSEFYSFSKKIFTSLFQNLSQDIEFLKKVKADKEVVEDLLAEKADASVVNRKVSHDQFDAACDDLTKGLDEALEKLVAQVRNRQQKNLKFPLWNRSFLNLFYTTEKVRANPDI